MRINPSQNASSQLNRLPGQHEMDRHDITQPVGYHAVVIDTCILSQGILLHVNISSSGDVELLQF